MNDITEQDWSVIEEWNQNKKGDTILFQGFPLLNTFYPYSPFLLVAFCLPIYLIGIALTS